MKVRLISNSDPKEFVMKLSEFLDQGIHSVPPNIQYSTYICPVKNVVIYSALILYKN